MNIPVAIVDENGEFHKMAISSEFLVKLSEMLRVEGITPIHTFDDNGKMRAYNAQAVVLMAKGCKGSMMFLNDSANDK